MNMSRAFDTIIDFTIPIRIFYFCSISKDSTFCGTNRNFTFSVTIKIIDSKRGQITHRDIRPQSYTP